jgi:hypothetical protein
MCYFLWRKRDLNGRTAFLGSKCTELLRADTAVQFFAERPFYNVLALFAGMLKQAISKVGVCTTCRFREMLKTPLKCRCM